MFGAFYGNPLIGLESAATYHERVILPWSFLYPTQPPWRKLSPRRDTGGNMLYYAVVFLVVALIAGFLGFGGVAFAAAGIAKILFFVFLLVFLLTLITHLMRGGAARS
jgi:uncharacterized membrane protein YtjA (UPF0391 family)